MTQTVQGTMTTLPDSLGPQDPLHPEVIDAVAKFCHVVLQPRCAFMRTYGHPMTAPIGDETLPSILAPTCPALDTPQAQWLRAYQGIMGATVASPHKFLTVAEYTQITLVLRNMMPVEQLGAPWDLTVADNRYVYVSMVDTRRHAGTYINGMPWHAPWPFAITPNWIGVDSLEALPFSRLVEVDQILRLYAAILAWPSASPLTGQRLALGTERFADEVAARLMRHDRYAKWDSYQQTIVPGSESRETPSKGHGTLVKALLSTLQPTRNMQDAVVRHITCDLASNSLQRIRISQSARELASLHQNAGLITTNSMTGTMDPQRAQIMYWDRAFRTGTGFVTTDKVTLHADLILDLPTLTASLVRPDAPDAPTVITLPMGVKLDGHAVLVDDEAVADLSALRPSTLALLAQIGVTLPVQDHQP